MRGLATLLLLPSMAMTCQPTVDPTQILMDRISPDVDVDPASVPPPDPSGQPTDRYRSIDGAGNHMTHFELGAANTTLRRMTPMDYGDSVASMGGAGRPSPREISNAVCAETLPAPNALGASDFLWQWGQFVDHDADESSDRDAGSSLGRGCVDVVAGGEQLRHEIALPIRASEVIAVDLELLGTGDRSRERVLTAGGYDLVACRYDDRGWHRDVRNPIARRETNDGARCLGERGGVGARHLFAYVVSDLRRLDVSDHAFDDLAEHQLGRHPSTKDSPGQDRAREDRVLLRREMLCCGAKDQSAYACRVPAPAEFRDRSAHRVSDGDELADAERVSHGDDIVCTVPQPKATRRDAIAMPAVIDRHDVVTLGEVGKSGEPIQCARRGKAMKQDQRGGSLGPLVLDHTNATPAFQVQEELLTPGGLPGSGRGLTFFSFFCHLLRA